MRGQQVNRASAFALIVLSLTALLDVLLLGYTRPPLPDEGAGAHIFQLAIVALVPTGFVFLATADWTQGNSNTGLAALGAGGALASPDEISSWSLLDPGSLTWWGYQFPHNVDPQALAPVLVEFFEG